MKNKIIAETLGIKVLAQLNTANVDQFMAEVTTTAKLKIGQGDGDLSKLEWSSEIWDGNNWSRLDELGKFVNSNKALFVNMAKEVHNGYFALNMLGIQIPLTIMTPDNIKLMIAEGTIKSPEMIKAEITALEAQRDALPEAEQKAFKKPLTVLKDALAGVEYLSNRYSVKGKGKIFRSVILDTNKFATQFSLSDAQKATLETMKPNDIVANSMLYRWQGDSSTPAENTLMGDIDLNYDAAFKQIQKEYLVGLQSSSIINSISTIAAILQGKNIMIDPTATALDNVLLMNHSTWSMENNWTSMASSTWSEISHELKQLDWAIFKSVVEQLNLTQHPQIRDIYAQGLQRFK